MKVINTTNGTVEQAIEYDSFGNILSNSSPDFQPFTLAGGIYDNDTKLVRFGARDYDAETGRWTSKDPIKFNGGRNFYSYCSGNPISKVDVNGLEESLIDGFLGLANLIASDIMSDYKFPFKNAKLWGIPFGTPISSGWAWIIGDFVIGYGGVIYDITVNDMSFMDAMGNYRGILGIVGRQLGTLLIEQAVMCYDKWDNYLFDTFSWVDINNTNLNYKDYVKNINELETLKKQKSKKNYSKYPIIKSPYDNY